MLPLLGRQGLKHLWWKGIVLYLIVVKIERALCRGVTIHRCIGESYRNCQRYESYRQWLNRFSRYFLWWQKSGNKVSLKSENLPNSPNKMSDKCYGMKFDLFDDQLLLKRHPTAQFNRWAKMGVVCNHVRNAALNGSNQFTPRQLFFNHVN